MRFITLLVIANFISLNVFSQFLENVFSKDFDSPNQINGFIDSSNSWFIGNPNKSEFDSSYSGENSIFTDTSFYRVNDSSSFIIKANIDYQCYGCFRFWHKYQTTNQKDGGFIEVRYNDNNNWVNILDDPSEYIAYTNIYTRLDTLEQGVPAFTGVQDNWEQVEICFDWFIPVKRGVFSDSIQLKFTFISDSIPDTLDGWIIDNIEIDKGTGPCSSVEEISKLNNSIKVYPNPVGNFVTINNFRSLDILKVDFYTLQGKLIDSYIWPENKELLKIPTEQISCKTFLIKISDNKGDYYTKQMIKDLN